MIMLRNFVLTAAAALACGACAPPSANTGASNGNSVNAASANTNVAKPPAAPATKEAIVALEKQTWDAWKARDGKPYANLLSDKSVTLTAMGRIDKAANIKALTDMKCDIKSFSFSDEQITPVGSDVAILTMKAVEDGVCDGKAIPANLWVASVYAREGNDWKSVLYAESPIVDPKAPPAVAKPASAPAAASSPDGAKPDAPADPVLAVEKGIWEAWKNKDNKTLDGALGTNFFWLSGAGRTDRADILKEWSTDNKCEVKSVSLTDAKTVSISSDVSMLTFRGGGAGQCEGQPIQTQWYGTIYQKSGDTWKPAFGTFIP
jgi:hypothetical protein